MRRITLAPAQETGVEREGRGDQIWSIPVTAGTYEIHWTYYAKNLLPDMPEDLVSNILKIEVTE